MKIVEMVNKWKQEQDLRDPDALDIISTDESILYLEDKLFGDYEPTKGPYPDFRQRLEKWINNKITEEEQKQLYCLVPKIFYVGRNEFDTLYRCAFHENYIRWLIDSSKLNITSSKIENEITALKKETWFCPITDSLRINGFYHINQINRPKYRPDWRSLSEFADIVKVKKYINKEGIKRIVLVEDFIGSGTQMKNAIEFIAKNIKIPTLVIPLLICPNGMKLCKQYSKKYPQLSFSPVINLPEDCFVYQQYDKCKDPLLKAIQKISLKYRHLIPCHNPLGYENTGAIVVMYTNCPDNTVPIIHSNETNKWEPLFPRVYREDTI